MTQACTAIAGMFSEILSNDFDLTHVIFSIIKCFLLTHNYGLSQTQVVNGFSTGYLFDI